MRRWDFKTVKTVCSTNRIRKCAPKIGDLLNDDALLKSIALGTAVLANNHTYTRRVLDLLRDIGPRI